MSKEFDKALAEAVSIHRELTALEDWRLSAKAWMRSLLGAAGTTADAYQAFKAELEARGEEFTACWSYIRAVERTMAGGGCRTVPTKNTMRILRGIAGLGTYEDARAETDMIASGNLWLLWAIAMEHTAERHPEVFGTVEDASAIEGRLAELRERRAALCATLSNSWQHDDIHVHDVRRDSSALIVFKAALPDLCPIMPKDCAGERLITVLANRPDDALWKAA